MDLGEEWFVIQVNELSNHIGQLMIGKTDRVAMCSLAVVLFNTMVSCGHNQEEGEKFLNEMLRDWKDNYSAVRKNADEYFRENDRS